MFSPLYYPEYGPQEEHVFLFAIELPNKKGYILTSTYLKRYVPVYDSNLVRPDPDLRWGWWKYLGINFCWDPALNKLLTRCKLYERDKEYLENYPCIYTKENWPKFLSDRPQKTENQERFVNICSNCTDTLSVLPENKEYCEPIGIKECFCMPAPLFYIRLYCYNIPNPKSEFQFLTCQYRTESSISRFCKSETYDRNLLAMIFDYL